MAPKSKMPALPPIKFLAEPPAHAKPRILDESTPVMALGSTERVGSFYNAYRGEFVHGNLFSRGAFWHPGEKSAKIRSQFITYNRDRNISSNYFFTSDVDEKMQYIEVSAAIKLNILSGMVSVSGSGSYLSDKRKSNKTINCTFQQHVSTGYDKIAFTKEGLGEYVDLSTLSDEVTHVVYMVERGVDILVDLQYHLDDDYDNMRVRAEASADIKGIISASGKADVEQKSHLKNEKMRFSVFADLEPPASLAPTSITDALQLINEFPALIKEDNEGVPLKYLLIDVKRLLSIFRSSITVDKVLNEIRAAEVQTVTQLVKTADEQMARFNDFFVEAEPCRMALGEPQFQRILEYRTACVVAESELKRKLAEVIPRIRSQKPTEEKSADEIAEEAIQDVVNWFEESALAKSKLTVFVDEFQFVKKWHHFFRDLHAKGVTLLHTERDYDRMKEVATVDDPAPTFIFFYQLHEDLTDSDWDLLNEDFEELCRATEPQGKKIYAVNLDELPNLQEREELPYGFLLVQLKDGNYLPYPEPKGPDQINILLLGAVNAGKSVFINSIPYYLNVKTVPELKEYPLNHKIKTLYVTPRLKDARLSNFGPMEQTLKHPSSNQHISPMFALSEPITQEPRKYHYFVKDEATGTTKRLCLIDTPGLAYWSDLPVRRRIAEFVQQLDEIHHVFVFPAVDEMLQSDGTHEFCLAEALAMLPNSVSDRISFLPRLVYYSEVPEPYSIYTNAHTKDTFFTEVLQKLQEKLGMSDSALFNKEIVFPCECYTHGYEYTKEEPFHRNSYLELLNKNNAYEDCAANARSLLQRAMASKPFPGNSITTLFNVRDLLPLIERVIANEELDTGKPTPAARLLLRARTKLASYLSKNAIVPVFLEEPFVESLPDNRHLKQTLQKEQLARAQLLKAALEAVKGREEECSEEEAREIVSYVKLVGQYGEEIGQQLEGY